MAPGTILRGQVVACSWPADRGIIPFDEEGDRPGTAHPGSGTQGFDAVTSVSICERVLLQPFTGRQLAYAYRAVGRMVLCLYFEVRWGHLLLCAAECC